MLKTLYIGIYLAIYMLGIYIASKIGIQAYGWEFLMTKWEGRVLK